jgi:hypothetical protein
MAIAFSRQLNIFLTASPTKYFNFQIARSLPNSIAQAFFIVNLNSLDLFDKCQAFNKMNSKIPVILLKILLNNMILLLNSEIFKKLGNYTVKLGNITVK